MNDEAKTTDLAINDGTWHHIAATWTSYGGLWQIFVDGKLMDTGSSFKLNQIIAGRI